MPHDSIPLKKHAIDNDISPFQYDDFVHNTLQKNT